MTSWPEHSACSCESFFETCQAWSSTGRSSARPVLGSDREARNVSTKIKTPHISAKRRAKAQIFAVMQKQPNYGFISSRKRGFLRLIRRNQLLVRRNTGPLFLLGTTEPPSDTTYLVLLVDLGPPMKRKPMCARISRRVNTKTHQNVRYAWRTGSLSLRWTVFTPISRFLSLISG